MTRPKSETGIGHDSKYGRPIRLRIPDVLSREDNALLCSTNPGTPMGELFRRFWLPALLPSELPQPDSDPIRFRILGEDLIAFRDTNGRPGFLTQHCPH